jgi:nitroimidazol reductase NimA-like FMN-containing flavoprotein (pyridoxamine 5'-phosphate oxidase superfamily)
MQMIIWTMERLSRLRSTGAMPSIETPSAPSAEHVLRPEQVLPVLAKRSFATLATTSPAGFPHVAGVLYGATGSTLWVSTLRSSRKARNVAENPKVAVCVPVRRLPLGPPSSVQWQATAEVVDLEDPELRRLADAGELKAVTGHGELELPGGCFLRITPRGRVHTYGLGMSLPAFLKDPLAAAGHADLT